MNNETIDIYNELHFPILKLETNILEQLKKINEELTELFLAYNNNDCTIEFFSECLDVIQAALGLLRMINKQKNSLLITAFIDHTKKLYERDWEFDGSFILKIQEE